MSCAAPAPGDGSSAHAGGEDRSGAHASGEHAGRGQGNGAVAGGLDAAEGKRSSEMHGLLSDEHCECFEIAPSDDLFDLFLVV